MPHFRFPCHYVHWTQVKDHENIKSKLLPKIDSILSENNFDNPFNENCTMVTSMSKQIDFIDRETMHKILGTHLEEMIFETNCFPHIKVSNIIVTEYWFNVYQKGDFQEMHNHTGVPEVKDGKRYDHTFSMIYILNSEEKDNSILFKSFDQNIPYFPAASVCEFGTGSVEEIKEGTLLIFSNELNHFLLPVKHSGRVTIAFNVACCFDKTS